jgi:hypothetical protein
MIAVSDYQKITLEDKVQFKKHYSKYPPPHSDYVFTTMISWHEYVDYYYTFFENNLLIMTKFKGNIQFRPPFGTYSHQLNKKIMHLAIKEGGHMPYAMIPTSIKNNLLQVYPDIKFVGHRDYYDYVYLTSDLAELAGKPYSKIRNRLNKFKKNTQYTVDLITEENFNEVKRFLERWCLWKDCRSDEILEHERKAILYSMEHFYELDLKGLFVTINDQIEAIAVFEQISSDTIIVHFEKGSPDYDGIYKLINWETAKHMKDQSTYINREGDMGVPGLRKAKLSYRPYHFNEVHNIEKTSLEKILI